MSRLMKDLTVDRERNPSAALLDRWDPAEEEDDDDAEVNIIDRSESSLAVRLQGVLTLLCPQVTDPGLANTTISLARSEEMMRR